MARWGHVWLAGFAAAALVGATALAQDAERDQPPPTQPGGGHTVSPPTQQPTDDEDKRRATTPTPANGVTTGITTGVTTGVTSGVTAGLTTDTGGTTGGDAGAGGKGLTTDYKLDLGIGPKTGLGGGYKLDYSYGDKPVGNAYTTTGAPCRFANAGGWFQPVQGVYQDDPAFPKTTWDFAKGPNDNPVINEIGLGEYYARLPMIAWRHTVVMGLEKYRSQGKVVPAYRHDYIVFKVAGNCNGVEPVRFRLSLKDIKGERVIWTSPEKVGDAPIAGYASGSSETSEVHVYSPYGLPPQDAGAFTISGPGEYTLIAELVRMDGSPTGLKLEAGGNVLVSHPPVVEFIPVSLSGSPTPAQTNDFSSFVDDVAEASHQFLPDYFPLEPEDLPTFSHDLLNLTRFDPHLSDPEKRADKFAANLTDRFGAAAVHSQASRVVVFVRNGAQGVKDYKLVRTTSSAAFSSSTKVIFVGVDPPEPGDRGAANGLPGAAPQEYSPGGSWGSSIVETVGHELNHTEPELNWSKSFDPPHNMITHCGKSEHNDDDKNFAFGVRIDVGGIEHRNVMDGRASLMSSESAPYPQWISQCTYAHLISAFQKSADPPVMMVRAIVSRDDGVMSARLTSGYDLPDGEVDTAAAAAPEWGIAVRAGGKSATYPIEPPWFTEEALSRDTVAILARIPDPPGAGELAITYKGKTLASRRLPAQPPSLSVQAPAPTGKPGQPIHLAWSAHGAGPILSSVYYSNNKGRWYVDELFEETANQFDVRIDPKAHDHVIKLVVTDGARSAQRIFHVTAP